MIAMELGLDAGTTSGARLLADIRAAVREIVTSKNRQVLLVIDEANLLRPEVFAELHTLTQFHHGSKNLVTLILCGQGSLLERLSLRSSAPLASRIITKAHLEPLGRSDIEDYVAHHLALAGAKKKLFEDGALTAIYQCSDKLLRKANSLLRGGLLAAATVKHDTVTAEHIRIAMSELF